MTEGFVLRGAVVTGATGMLGSALVQRLLDEQIRVLAVTRPNSSRIDAVPAGAEKIACDLSELRHLPDMISEPVDAFFHLGWEGTGGASRQNAELQTRNIQASVDAAQAAHILGCKVFLFAGSQAECGRINGMVTDDVPCRPETCYGAAKLCAGEMTLQQCGQYGLRHIWMRILSIFGPNDSPNYAIPTLIRQLRQGEIPALTKGEQLWDYLYSEDAAKALLLAARYGHHGEIYPLGSGIARPLREYFESLRDIVAPGASLGFGQVPYSPNQVMRLQADISKLARDTGFMPSFTFEQGMKRMLQSDRSSEREG